MLRARAEADEYEKEDETPVRTRPGTTPSTGDAETRVSDSAMLIHLAGDVEYAKAGV